MATLFGKSTFATIPEELTNDHAVYENYMAEIWYDFLLHYDLQTTDTIVEIAPGASSKIGLALQKAAFRGTIYLVDPLKEALESLTEKYQNYMPDAIIYPCYEKLENALRVLPERPDFILANHPFDDMLLASISGEVTSDLFNSMTKKHQSAARTLERNPYPGIESVVHCWIKTLEKLSPKATIISQYPSLNLTENHLGFLNSYATLILDRLKEHYRNLALTSVQEVLNAHENYNNFHLGASVLNAENWFVLTPKVSF